MIDYLKDVKSVGIIGLAKNTGKTTTLNFLIDQYKDRTIGLTSIGLDGEKIDQVNFLPKPQIKVYPGMVVATAKMCLEQAEVPFELIYPTTFSTALGKVDVVKILKEGHIMLAGPTTNRELNQLMKIMAANVDLIFVDGALSRMTFSAISELDGIVLATGASYSESMAETKLKTKFVIESFNYPLFEGDIPEKAAFYVGRQKEVYLTTNKSMDHIKKTLTTMKNDISIVYIKGAITEKMMNLLIDIRLKDVSFVVDDPTKLMFHHTYGDVFQKLGIRVYVKKRCQIHLITVNPFRPLGSSYQADVFHQEIKQLTTIPVINVWHTEG